MTEKQLAVCYYCYKGYNTKQASLIAGVSDTYARRIINRVDEIDLSNYLPPVECTWREQTLRAIVDNIRYVYVPNSQKYYLISLMGYLGYDYHTVRSYFPSEETSFIYMAIHRSNKAWKELDPTIFNISHADYNDLMRLKNSERQ